MNRFCYLLKQGVKNIFTHGFMSFASITIIIACLLIMGSFSLLTLNIDAMIDEMQNQNNVLAYIDESLSESEARALESKILAVDNVATAEFVTREEAMENFESDYDENLFENIDPTVFRHRFVITLDDLSLMKETQAALRNVKGVASVTAHVDYAEKFISFRNIVSIVSLILIVILIIVSLFIMTNTIKLATFGRREEIAIMKMVGATNAFIRLPFVIEGLVLGAVGGGIAYLLQWGLYSVLTDKIMSGMASGIIDVLPFSAVALPVLIVFLAVGILVGVFGGLNAIRNYLKV
ncbi:MAG: permease-like cell division protein FtsX [Oscillospiraceae bacterium]|nr:permease-like cell division protein FtsX [Clostridiales bacterium]MDD6108061.1 permease-like cell division protein FtsX [Clostridiales bacterium]MDY5595777.1 permease-like cell division protein FtsX [Oscillospiraceae bacterium]